LPLTTPVSLPPERVTFAHEPGNASQVPSPLSSGASSRSTMPDPALTPDPVSLPLASVTGTESEVK
jgi:hypothetical protein